MAIENATINLAVESAIGVQTYAEAGYFPLGYFSHTFEAQDTDQAQANLKSSIRIGTQQAYLDTQDYIEAGYFESTIEAAVESGEEVIMTIGSSVSVDATKLVPADVSISSNLQVGDFYVEEGYIEVGYFEDAVSVNVLRGVEVDTDIAGVVTLTANTEADAVITMSSTSSMLVTAAGTVFDADVSLAVSSSVSVTAAEVTQGEVSVSITSATSIAAIADLVGEVLVNIAATTSIQANAESSGEIEPGITVTLTCIAQVFKVNPRYTLLIPKETRVNKITQETRQVTIPKQTRELEFFV